MIPEAKILIAFGLDLVIGDPWFFPHPVRGIGWLISLLESWLKRGKGEKAAGVLLVLITVGVVYSLVAWLASLSVIIEIILIYTVLAVNCLGKEALKIYKLLVKDDLEGARKQIGYLVSRQTANLDRQGITRAAVETVSENITDGIIAPLFYLFIGGIPLAYAYKAINTMDSMVGYKNEKYLHFGWAAARLDDIVNWLPARITGFVLIPIAALLCGFDAAQSLRIVIRDRLKHPSPNSGHGEAAVAGALGVQLGGSAVYTGKLGDKPLLGDRTRELQPADIRSTILIMFITACLGLGAGLSLIHFIR